LQRGATDRMITPVHKLIAYISTILPLLTGDVIVSGTLGGVGAQRNPPFWADPGDVTEVAIGCIGILRNTVEVEA
jgi:2-keto-4-pentenoate hydratase/2-oxohepta-3-ene-1,7-dioic acid hydratase in catechol pathway